MSGSVNSLWMFRAEGAVMNLLVWSAMSWNYTTNSSKKFWAPRRLVTLSVCLSLQCKCLQDCVDISLWEQRAACTHSCSFIRDVERLGKASFQNNLSYCFSNYSREVNLRTPALSLCLSVTAAKPVIRSRRLDSGDSRQQPHVEVWLFNFQIQGKPPLQDVHGLFIYCTCTLNTWSLQL